MMKVLQSQKRPKSQRHLKKQKFRYLRAAIWPSTFLSFSLALTACGNPAGGDPTDGIGPTEHRIFVTSLSFPGDLGGVLGADQKCGQAALNAGLLRPYKAIISDDSETASNRLSLVGAVYLFSSDGSKEEVVALGQDLWGSSLLTPIDKDENGGNRIVTVWSGTDTDGGNAGATFSNCSNWTSSSSGLSGTYGLSDQPYDAWIEDGGVESCDGSYALYCISQ